MLSCIYQKIESNQAISRAEAEWLYQSANLKSLSELATLAKSRQHPTNEASYLIMAVLNYTNICVAACDYCSFYRLPHEKDAYLLSFEELKQRIEKALSHGGTLISFNGGFHPKLRIHDYAKLFAQVHETYPHLTFYEMTVAEFMFTCKLSKISYAQGAEILKQAGTQWITGGGAEILDNRFRRRHSPGKYTVEDYFQAQEAILQAGMGSTATMVIGFDESLEERFHHLESLRTFQDRQQYKLTSFLCWTYKPFHNRLGGVELATEEYLRWLAICRIYLHNFAHIRTSVLTKNEEALQGLLYGANDFDLPIEDEVTEKAGATIDLNFDAILDVARGLNFETIRRGPFPTPYSEAARIHV